MKLQQLSLFVENKPGHLLAPCKTLAEAGINILTMSLADTEQFGILRLLIADWQKAKAVLEEKGFVVNLAEVVAVEIEDRPGGLAELLEIMAAEGIDVEYTYAFTFGRENKAILIFRFEDPDGAITKLQARDINPIKSIDLYEG